MEANAAASYGRSQDAYSRACKFIPGGVSSNVRLEGEPFPLYFARASGSHVWDVDGTEYVDYVCGMGPIMLGHAHQAVIEAVKQQLDLGQVYGASHEKEAELAELICRLVPSAERVRLGTTGSEMVQTAMRLSRAATGRRLIVKFEGHYHGWLDGSLVSVHPPLTQAGPRDRPRSHLPSRGQPAGVLDDVVVLPWNDLEAVASFLDRRGGDVAGVILEPILCNSSVVIPRDGYLAGLRRLTERHGVVLIFDEVITGFRVALGGAQGRLGVTPDLTVLAKAIAGGFPLAALAGRADLMDELANGVNHSGTYNGNTTAVAAGIATLNQLARDDGAVYGVVERLGDELRAGIETMGREHDVQLRAQGLGMVFNTAFSRGPITDYRDFEAADTELALTFQRKLQDRRVRIVHRGTWFLCAAHTATDIEMTLAAADAALDDVLHAQEPHGRVPVGAARAPQ
jgi:glutamate-1-semialdehyde 2,1-aminomutase